MDPLEYYAAHHCALFPIPAGQKAPWGIVESFKSDWSKDPAQWAKWRAEHNCNFGLVAFASGLIICDIDIKPSAGQTVDEAKIEAWETWGNLCLSWGLAEPLAPYCTSPHGGWHVLCAVPQHIDAATLRQPDAIKGRINVRVIGYTVAAGSFYDGTEKNDAPGHYKLFENAPAPHSAPLQLLEHCSPKVREKATKKGAADPNHTRVVLDWMIEHEKINGDEEWRTVGMILRDEFGDDPGLELFERICFNQHADSTALLRWRSFAHDKPDGVGIGTLRTMASNAGCPYRIKDSFESILGGTGAMAAAAAAGVQFAEPPLIKLPPSTPGPTNPAAEQNEADEIAHPTPAGGFLNFPETFGDDFFPPDYLVDGILQRRFCYSLTAQTGVGKTTVAMRLAAHVAIGKKLGDLDVEKGTVLYFAGENPEDVKMRWFGLCQDMNIDPKKTDVIYVYGAMHFSKTLARIRQGLDARNVKLSLVVVDTVAAFFEGDNDNDNVQMGNHARSLRALSTLPGGPCVVVLAHPTKNAQDDNLVPRGGGAFLNEVDGNISLRKDETTLTAAALGKFRGPEFAPINFELKVIGNHPRLKDTKGRQIPTIIARPISGAQKQINQETIRKSEDKVLDMLCNTPGIGPGDMAKVLGYKDHSPVSKRLKKLKDAGLADNPGDRGLWIATPKGQKTANLVATVAAKPVQPLPRLTPAVLGPSGTPTPLRAGTPPPMPPVPV